jgi:hypothetical protein
MSTRALRDFGESEARMHGIDEERVEPIVLHELIRYRDSKRLARVRGLPAASLGVEDSAHNPDLQVYARFGWQSSPCPCGTALR